MITTGEQLNRTNKRKLRRIHNRCRITFSVNGVFCRGLSSNFSLEGLFIRTSAVAPVGTLLDITIHYPNDFTSHIQGKVVRVTEEAFRSTAGKGKRNGEKGMGIRILRKDSLYLHFIHALIENAEEDVLGRFLFADTESECRTTDPALQKNCRLFDVNALVIADHSAGDTFSGKAWFEARMKNNTNHVFREPVVVFMTTHDCTCLKNEIPDIGVLMMSSPQNNSYWKPGEIITLTGEIDSLVEESMYYELAFFNYVTRILKILVEEPVKIDDFVTTLWLGSSHLVADPQEVRGNMLPILV
jgi:hypothetical protein